jgi:hypothetical protein
VQLTITRGKRSSTSCWLIDVARRRRADMAHNELVDHAASVGDDHGCAEGALADA